MSAIRIESPFPEYAIPRVWAWIEPFRARVQDDYGPQDNAGMVARIKAAPMSWGVWRDGELGGLVTGAPMSPRVVESHCIFKKSFWGHETTLAALRLVYAEVFALGFEKIFGLAFENPQLLGVVYKMGFRSEGRLREHTLQGGKPVDMVAIGLLKRDFKESDDGDTGGVGRVDGVQGEHPSRADGNAIVDNGPKRQVVNAAGADSGTADAHAEAVGLRNEPDRQSGSGPRAYPGRPQSRG